MNNNEKDKFTVAGTKLEPKMAEVLNACCDVLGVDTYHLFQWFAYTIIKAAAPWHELDPRIQKLLAFLESDVGWQEAFNIASPEGNLKVAQAILILEQEDHKGFGAVMIDKPFMGEARQTECVDTILERVTEVTMRGIYRRLRLMGAKMKCQNLSDVLLTMIDAQTMLNLDEGFRAELPGMGSYDDRGKAIAYGKKTKAKQHRTPDSFSTDQRIKFDNDDKALADIEAGYKPEEWEGEHRQTKERPIPVIPFDPEDDDERATEGGSYD